MPDEPSHDDEPLIGEVVDAELVEDAGLPALAGMLELDADETPGLPASPLARPAVQAAAAAATGFLAGAAALALLRRGDARAVARQARELAELRDRLDVGRRGAEPIPFLPGRTYLVQFRVLSAPPHVVPRRPNA